MFKPPLRHYEIPRFDPQRLRQARVLIAGLGNIGSYLAPLIGGFVGFVRLVDRDRVEQGNFVNQAYWGKSCIGQSKVDVVAERLQAEHPHLVIERRAMDLDDLPLGDVADVDICFGGLDSLRARKMLVSDRAFPLGVPVIDGGVGSPLLGNVRVYMPGAACLECVWSGQHYRALATEYPCFGQQSTAAVSPALLGQTTAALMIAEAIKLLTGHAGPHSRELAFDLLQSRFLTSRLSRAAGCRHDHEVVSSRALLPVPFAEATAGALLAFGQRQFGGRFESLAFRRLKLGDGVFGDQRLVSAAALQPYGDAPLAKLGLSPRDFVRLRASRPAESMFVVFDSRLTPKET